MLFPMALQLQLGMYGTERQDCDWLLSNPLFILTCSAVGCSFGPDSDSLKVNQYFY